MPRLSNHKLVKHKTRTIWPVTDGKNTLNTHVRLDKTHRGNITIGNRTTSLNNLRLRKYAQSSLPNAGHSHTQDSMAVAPFKFTPSTCIIRLDKPTPSACTFRLDKSTLSTYNFRLDNLTPRKSNYRPNNLSPRLHDYKLDKHTRRAV